jgi:4-amino-4-deoxychorismate lyase
MSMRWCNGERVDRIDMDDRGLRYGDGFFTTMRVQQARIVFWPQHRHRLLRASGLLRFPAWSMAQLEQELNRIARAIQQGVLRCQITRLAAQRGDAVPEQARVQRLVWADGEPAPQTIAPLRLGFAQAVLNPQANAPGIKLLARIDHMLAATGAQQRGWDDALMCNAQGEVICSTRANLFVVRKGQLLTPPIQHCGVRGVFRRQIVTRSALPLPLLRKTLRRDDILNADEVFLCNAVRGLMPVASLEDSAWSRFAVCHALGAQWHAQMGLPEVPETC